MKKPIYQRIYAEIRKRIRNGTYKGEQKLPPERELAKEFDCSFLTVRQALGMLVDEGAIVRRVGQGTFVGSAPDAEARGRRLGVLFNPAGGAYASKILGELQDVAAKSGIELVVEIVLDFATLGQAINRIKSAHCGAAVLPWFQSQEDSEHVREALTASPIPVAIAEVLSGLEANCCESPKLFGKGDFYAIEVACEYFHELGFGHIAFLAPNDSALTLQRRLYAYTRWITTHGMVNLAGLVSHSAAEIDRLVSSWANHAGDLAIIAYDDTTALRTMTSLHKAGLRIPGDAAVLGFNDIPAARSADPPLSTLSHSYGYSAGALIAHAQAMARGGSAQATDGGAPHRMIIRESCGGKQRKSEKLWQTMGSLQLGGGYEIAPDRIEINA